MPFSPELFFFSPFILVFFFEILIIAFLWMVPVGTLLHWETKLFMGARYWRALFTCFRKEIFQT